nr:MAG TPA: crossover junction endodeoxyribonuclease [Caudoviricetes sp.]
MKIILRCQFRFRKKTHERFPTLNEYIDCERGSTIAAAAMKKKCTEQVRVQCIEQRITPVIGKVDMLFEWHSSTRHDPDNIAFAKKFILDGLQLAGVIENDNRKCIGTMADDIISDAKDYVVVHISENMGIFI